MEVEDQLLIGQRCSGLRPQVERVGTAKASLLVQRQYFALQAMKLFALFGALRFALSSIFLRIRRDLIHFHREISRFAAECVKLR